MCCCFWLIYTLRKWLCWMEDGETPWMHKYGEYQWLELWWQLYVTTLPEWNLTKFEAAWFLLDRVYNFFFLVTSVHRYNMYHATFCNTALLVWQVCMLMPLFKNSSLCRDWHHIFVQIYRVICFCFLSEHMWHCLCLPLEGHRCECFASNPHSSPHTTGAMDSVINPLVPEFFF
jgi:hypothetical protein